MKTIRLTDKLIEHLVAWLSEHANGGLLVSGDSGSGKSNAYGVLIEAAIRTGIGTTILDPKGSLARLAEEICHREGDDACARMTIFHPAEGLSAPLNPVAVADPAERAARVALTTRITLQSFGEADANGRPLVWKYTTLGLEVVSLLGLPMLSVLDVLNCHSPFHDAIVAAIPDPIIQADLLELRALAPAKRHELVGAALNRFDFFFKNTHLRPMFSAKRGTDFGALIRGSGITIVNLEMGKVLRPEDRQVLSCCVLMEILQSVFSTPAAERVPHFLWIDELPLFAPLFDVCAQALRETREYKLRIAGATQGTFPFPEKTDDRLLNSFLANCACHLFFRHTNATDAKFYATTPFLHTYHPLKIKHVLKQMQQYTHGQKLVTLVNEAVNWSNAQQRGSAQALGLTDQRGENEDESNSISAHEGHTTARAKMAGGSEVASEATTQGEPGTPGADRRTTTAGKAGAATHADTVSAGHQHGRGRQRGQRRGRNASHGSQRTDTANASDTATQGGGRSVNQVLTADLRWREVVQAIQFLSAEEQHLLWTRLFVLLLTGHSLMYVAGKGIVRLIWPLAKKPSEDMPNFIAAEETALRERLLLRPEYQLRSSLTELYQPLLQAYAAAQLGRRGRKAKELPPPQGLLPTVLPPDAGEHEDDSIIDI